MEEDGKSYKGRKPKEKRQWVWYCIIGIEEGKVGVGQELEKPEKASWMRAVTGCVRIAANLIPCFMRGGEGHADIRSQAGEMNRWKATI